MEQAKNPSLWGTPRENNRFDIPDDVDAKIALTREGGEPDFFELLEMSMRGLSFRVDHPGWTFQTDQELDPVTLRVHGRQVHGTAEVVHQTSSFATGTYCGIRFTPATEADLKALIEVVQFLEARQ